MSRLFAPLKRWTWLQRQKHHSNALDWTTISASKFPLRWRLRAPEIGIQSLQLHFFGGRDHFFEAERLLWNVDISGQGGNQIRYAIVIRIIRRILRWVWMKGVMTGAISQDISEPLHIIAVLRLVLPERERRRSSQKR